MCCCISSWAAPGAAGRPFPAKAGRTAGSGGGGRQQTPALPSLGWDACPLRRPLFSSSYLRLSRRGNAHAEATGADRLYDLAGAVAQQYQPARRGVSVGGWRGVAVGGRACVRGLTIWVRCCGSKDESFEEAGVVKGNRPSVGPLSAAAAAADAAEADAAGADARRLSRKAEKLRHENHDNGNNNNRSATTNKTT